MRRSRWYLCGVAAAWLTLATGWAHAKATAGLSDLKAIALQRLETDPAYARRLTGGIGADDPQQAARDYLLDLFEDDAFIRAMRSWIATQQGQDADGLYAAWAEAYGATLLRGVALFSDDELLAMLQSTPIRQIAMDEELCRLAQAPVANAEALASRVKVSVEERASALRLMKRAYLAALANEKPRALPTEAEVGAAHIVMLTSLPPADRDRLIAMVKGGAESGDCAAGGIYYQAVLRTPGNDGRILRRHLLVTALREQVERPMPSASTTAVEGVVQPEFQPGNVPLEYPRVASTAGIEGTMRVRIWVDERGYATRVKTIERSFSPASARLSDGTELTADELFDPVVTVFYRSGRFLQRFKDGKPEPYQVVVPLNWHLK